MKIEAIKKTNPIIITLETEDEINSMYHALLMAFDEEKGIMTSGGQNLPLPNNVSTVSNMYYEFSTLVCE